MSLNPSAVNAARFGRALLALTAAATIAASPYAADALGPAGSRGAGHAVAAYALAKFAHDVGHNDWAFQSTTADGLGWAATYLAVGLFWAAIAVWLRRRGGRYLGRVLTAAWGTLLLCAGLSLGAAWFAQGDSTFLAPLALHVADLCSPWWACVAATGVVAWAERNTAAARGVLAYAVVLAVLLLVQLPGPDAVKALVLAASAAVPALVTPRQWDGPTECVRPATG
jgi:hypothetical protein